MASIYKLALPFSVISPAAPSAPAPSVSGTYSGLDDYGVVVVDAFIPGAVGGTLDVYFQSSVKGGRWYDVAHLPQIAAAAAGVRYTFSITRARGGAPTSPVVTSDVSVTGASQLAANTVLAQSFGDSIRMVLVAGSGTTAGAALVVDGAAYQI